MRRLLACLRVPVSFPWYGLFWTTLFYGLFAVFVELYVPQCLFDFDDEPEETSQASNTTSTATLDVVEPTNSTIIDPDLEEDSSCLQNGVDASTSTILTGFLTTLWMFGLALHLWSIKCCYIPRWDEDSRSYVHDDFKGNVRPSGIYALVWGGVSVLLSTLAKVLQPHAGVGQTLYWSLLACSYPPMAFSVYCHGHFAMRSINQRLRVCCSCCSRLGLTVGLVFLSGFLNFGAGLSCGLLDADDGSEEDANVFNTSLSDGSIVSTSSALQVPEDNVFEHNGGDERRKMRWLQENNATNNNNSTEYDLEITPLELEHVCQDISYYGNFVFAFCLFFFWYAISKVLRRGARRHKYHLNGSYQEDTKVFGMEAIAAITLLPWISFFLGNLYPVWVWLSADFSNNYWLEVSLLAKSGFFQHYGLLLMALLSHNWFRTLTYRTEDPEGDLAKTVWNDLTLGAFESKRTPAPKPQDQESMFNDLTFGAFEGKQKNQTSNSTYYSGNSTTVRDDDTYDYY